MNLLVASHKVCWRSDFSPTGFATDGGFPFQMKAISQLFDSTTLLLPCASIRNQLGEIALEGNHLQIKPLPPVRGVDLSRKLRMIPWTLGNIRTIWCAVRKADAVHTPIPSDIGTICMLIASLMQKPLFVRHCGNWNVQNTFAERFWRWFMECYAGGQNVMFATGGDTTPPSKTNPNIEWIFSTTLDQQEIETYSFRRRISPQLPPRLIIVCRQDMEKGTGHVLRAMPYLVEKYPGVCLDVVGDGIGLNSFKMLASSLGLGNHVIFHGRVNHAQVMKLLSNADIFVYPTSASEGFPKVVLEAMACGLPIVTTPVSVLPNLLKQGGGVLLEKVEPSCVAHHVDLILSDPEGYSKLSTQASTIAKEYTLEAWTNTLQVKLNAEWGILRAENLSKST